MGDLRFFLNECVDCSLLHITKPQLSHCYLAIFCISPPCLRDIDLNLNILPVYGPKGAQRYKNDRRYFSPSTKLGNSPRPASNRKQYDECPFSKITSYSCAKHEIRELLHISGGGNRLHR